MRKYEEGRFIMVIGFPVVKKKKDSYIRKRMWAMIGFVNGK